MVTASRIWCESLAFSGRGGCTSISRLLAPDEGGGGPAHDLGCLPGLESAYVAQDDDGFGAEHEGERVAEPTQLVGWQPVAERAERVVDPFEPAGLADDIRVGVGTLLFGEPPVDRGADDVAEGSPLR